MRLKERADTAAIDVFKSNLKDLLLAAPAGPRVTMGLDPGIRTGVKVAVVDQTGKLLDTSTVYPHEPRNDWNGALATLAALCLKHKVDVIAIGNGTASRETDKLAGDLIKKMPDLKLDEGHGLRGRRVGLFRFRAGRQRISRPRCLACAAPYRLRGVCRTRWPNSSRSNPKPSASVSTSTTSTRPRSRVRSMLSSKTASTPSASTSTRHPRRSWRASPASTRRSRRTSCGTANENGAFKKRTEIKKVARLGPKAFEQAAGFLRIMNGPNPLDASAVHPEAYEVVERIAEATKRPIKAIIGDSAFLKSLDSPSSSPTSASAFRPSPTFSRNSKSPVAIRAPSSRRPNSRRASRRSRIFGPAWRWKAS